MKSKQLWPKPPNNTPPMPSHERNSALNASIDGYADMDAKKRPPPCWRGPLNARPPGARTANFELNDRSLGKILLERRKW
jgi:hypothetical protein